MQPVPALARILLLPLVYSYQEASWCSSRVLCKKKIPMKGEVIGSIKESVLTPEQVDFADGIFIRHVF